MRPQRALSMSSSARRVQWKAPERLVSTTACHSSAGMRMVRPSWRTPALLTSTRIGPKRSRTSSKAACDLLGVADVGLHVARRCGPGARRSSRRSRRRSAMAAPMPRVPPVTSAQPSWPLRADMRRAPSSSRRPRPTRSRRRRRPGRRWRRASGGPSRSACSRASGIEADDVLATRSTLTTTFSAAARARAAAASMMRTLAWWATKRSMSSTVQPGARERLAGRRGHARDGVAVDLGALHAQHALVALGVEQVGLRAVGAEHEAADAELELAARDDHGAGAVAEQHGRRAVVVVGDATERLGAAHEHDRRAAATRRARRPGRGRRGSRRRRR